MAGNHYVIFLGRKFHQFQSLMTIDLMIKEAIQKRVDYSWIPNLFKIVMQLSRKVLIRVNQSPNSRCSVFGLFARNEMFGPVRWALLITRLNAGHSKTSSTNKWWDLFKAIERGRTNSITFTWKLKINDYATVNTG